MTQAAAAASPVDTMTPFQLLFHDVKSEMVTTRRILERVPDGNDDWRPHAKSSTLSGLATHVAQLPGLGITILTKDEFDAASRKPDPKLTSNAERLKLFDTLSGEFLSLLEKQTWDQAVATWRFRAGERTIAQGPRAQMTRSIIITHIAHHRAQLGVYLRLLGIPLPSTYGPTADEPVGAR